MLENCKPGDILISKHGTILRFVKHLSKTDYYDCEVEYLIKDGKYNKTLGNGTRNYDGSVFKNNKRDDDEDIIQVISKVEFKKIKHVK